MTYRYKSPIGDLYITSDGKFLTRIEFFSSASEISEDKDNVIGDTVRWLDVYFSHSVPDFTPRYKLCVSEFSQAVLNECAHIGYGEICTYGDIAKRVSSALGKNPCARAVGGALNRNPIPIIIPCHRVIGCKRSPVGFAPGVDVKLGLLAHEGVFLKK